MSGRVIEMTGDPGTTFSHTCGDTAETLDDVSNFVFSAVNALGENKVAIGCLITCETNDIKFAWTSTPTQGATGLGHVLAAGNSLKLTNHKQIRNITFINKTNGSDALLQITPEFSP